MAADLGRVADSEAPRNERARAAAELIRSAGGYRWVGIYDVGDEQIATLGEAGASSTDEAIRTRATVVSGSTIVPILGAESGIVIGTLEVQGEGEGALTNDAVEFLESSAALLRPLYD